MAPVLVGIDGSPQSASALRWAGWFATTTGRDLHVAHAWQHGRRLEPLLPSSAGEFGVEELESGICARLREIVAEELGDSSAAREFRALRGETADTLRSEAQRVGATVLVVGARGAGGALRALLGSVSHELTQCPAHAVAVIPDDFVPPAGASWTAVVGVDGSDGSSRAVRWAAASAQRGGGHVVAVHALEPPVADLSPREQASVIDEARHRLEDEWCGPLLRAGVSFDARVEKGPADDVITRTADALRPACVVVGSRGLGALSQRLLGSVTYRLVRESIWPTVVIPAPRDCVIWTLNGA